MKIIELARVCYPVLIANNDETYPIGQNGTCFIVLRGDRLFAITARHCVWPASVMDLRIAFHEGAYAPVLAGYQRTGERATKEDPEDLYIVELALKMFVMGINKWKSGCATICRFAGRSPADAATHKPDRVLFRGHLKLRDPRTLRIFLAYSGVLLKDFGAYAEAKTAELRAHAERLTAEARRPFLYLHSPHTARTGHSKEQLARDIARRDGARAPFSSA